MKTNKESLLSLISENQKSMEILESIFQKVQTLKERLKRSSEDEYLWIAMSQLLSTYYTLSETILFRNAQNFGNNLDPSQWHKSLLGKMRVRIEGIRPAFLSDALYQNLDSLRRFRHFLKYYHELTLDIEEITLLVRKTEFIHTEFKQCHKEFSDFTKNLVNEADF